MADRELSPSARDLLGGATTTRDLHSIVLSTGRRTYRGPRQALHAAIVARAIEGATVRHPPTALFLAGGPASGKSALVDALDLPTGVVRIDPDRIKATLPEYQALVASRDPSAAVIAHEESSDIAAALLASCFAQRLSVVVDGTGDAEEGKFVNKLRRALAHGYEVSVAYADVPVEAALARQRKRAERTGRAVPEDVLRATYAAVAARSDEVLALDGLRRVALYDTSVKPATLYAEKLGDAPLNVSDADRLEAFRAKARA